MPKKNSPGCTCCNTPACPDGTTTQVCGTAQMTCPGGGGAVAGAPGITVTAVGRTGQGTFSAVTDASGFYCVVVTRIGTYDVTIEGACPITFAVTFIACNTTIFTSTRTFNMARFRFEISRECSGTITQTPTITGPPGFSITGYLDPVTFKQIYCVSLMGTYTWTVAPLLDGGGHPCTDGASGSATPDCSSIPLFTGTVPASTHTVTYRGIGCNDAVVDTKTTTFKTGCTGIANVTLSADRYNTLVVDNTGVSFSECTDIIVNKTMTVADGYQCLCCHKPIVLWPKIQDSLGEHTLDSTGQSDCLIATDVTLAGDPDQCGPPVFFETYPYYYQLSCASSGGNQIWQILKCGPACFVPIPGEFCPAPGTCTGDPTSPVAATGCVLPRTPAGACVVAFTTPVSLDACPPSSTTASIDFFGWVETVTVITE